MSDDADDLIDAEKLGLENHVLHALHIEYHPELYLTTLVVKLTAICDQMSVRYKANKSADKESQFSELRRSQRKKKNRQKFE